MAKRTRSETADEADTRSRAAAGARARELERSGHTRLADAFRDYAERRTNGRALDLSDYLDEPDVELANAARAVQPAVPEQLPGFVPADAAVPEPAADDAFPGSDDFEPVPDPEP